MGFATAQGSSGIAGFGSAQGAGASVAAPSISYAGSPFSWPDLIAISAANVTNTGGSVTSYAVQAGSLPSGISLNTSTGALTGTPSGVQAAANVTIRATGPGGTSDAVISIAVTTSLLTSLVAYWELDEASGTRNDSHTNALHLTDNNTVGSGLGVDGVSTAADFVAANSEYLSRASGWFNPAAQDMTLSVWAKMNADGTAGGIFEFANCFLLEKEASNQWSIFWRADTAYHIRNKGTATVAAGWRHLIVTVTSSTKAIVLYENNVSVGTGTYTSDASSGLLEIGRYSGNYITGNVQCVGFWNRVVTLSERTELYNGGTAALTYADIST